MDLRETSLGFYRAWHAGLGARHGLLAALRQAPATPAGLAKAHALDVAAVEDWCRGAAALGLLARDRRGRYELLAEHHDTLGEPSSRDYLGHHFAYATQKSLGFAALDARLRGEDPTKARASTLAETYAIATRWDHVAFFDELARDRSLTRALERGIDILDLGAGHGGWTREAQARFPNSRFTAADLDLTPLADLRALDARRLPARAFDLIFLGEVLATTRTPARILRAAQRALRPGARLVALEGVAPTGSARAWGERLVLAMQLDFALDGSRYWTLPELRAAFRDAGLGRMSARDLGGSLYLLSARKPQT